MNYVKEVKIFLIKPVNYNFFGEYGHSDYKTFTDEQLLLKTNPYSYLTYTLKSI